MPKDPGLCKAKILRYYYDKDCNKCLLFIYGGCGGNGNRFSTKQECQKKCGKIPIIQQSSTLAALLIASLFSINNHAYTQAISDCSCVP